MRLVGLLAPFVSSPVLLFALRAIDRFSLEPLAIWRIDAEPIVFVCACFGAALVYVRRSWHPLGRLLTAVVALVVSYFVYGYLANNPPTRDTKWIYDAAAYITFPLCHIAFGYSVAEIAKRFIKEGGKKAASKKRVRAPPLGDSDDSSAS